MFISDRELRRRQQRMSCLELAFWLSLGLGSIVTVALYGAALSCWLYMKDLEQIDYVLTLDDPLCVVEP